jgi:transcriptional regulator with XRE-family HTH domain
MNKPIMGFTDEGRRLRIRKAELDLKNKDIAAAIGITPQDVTNVINCRSKSPRYIAEVYNLLGLDMPEVTDERLHERITELGLKIISDATGISVQAITMIINGQSNHPQYVKDVYKYLGLELNVPDTPEMEVSAQVSES